MCLCFRAPKEGFAIDSQIENDVIPYKCYLGFLFRLFSDHRKILRRGYPADEQCICYLHIRVHYFPQMLCICSIQTAQTLVDIKANGICVYAHICACHDKAAQMYFRSMNYATRRQN